MAEEKVVVTGEPFRAPGALNEQPKREKYKLKAGARHFHEGSVLSNEEEVELTEPQVKAFGDKFDKVGEDPEKRVPLTPPPDPSGDGDGAGAVGASPVPQDVGAATRDPKLPNVNPNNDVPIGGVISGSTVPTAPPARSSANTSAATGSPLSPDPTPKMALPSEAAKLDPKNKPEDASSTSGSQPVPESSKKVPGTSTPTTPADAKK